MHTVLEHAFVSTSSQKSMRHQFNDLFGMVQQLRSFHSTTSPLLNTRFSNIRNTPNDPKMSLYKLIFTREAHIMVLFYLRLALAVFEIRGSRIWGKNRKCTE